MLEPVKFLPDEYDGRCFNCLKALKLLNEFKDIWDVCEIHRNSHEGKEFTKLANKITELNNIINQKQLV